ncbi:hypothetical protein GH714_018873 [Hevea brasiliensis]|uniref:Tubby C-terminal domain-containing protein n=1 Tax=Hevea brasiliensis TaxID=3981 RepID=A0A6A6M3I1_HEVBR|nr:hypothetical protein GH714_018873 [Hevea brasiliensis]
MTTYQPLQSPVAVIGPQFLAQYPVDLKVATKLLALGECNLGVTDVNGTLIFKVKSKLLSIRDRRYLLDAAGNILATFQQKMHRKHTLSTVVFDADNFGVTVYPNVDCAFIVALVVILDEINEDRRGDD